MKNIQFPQNILSALVGVLITSTSCGMSYYPPMTGRSPDNLMKQKISLETKETDRSHQFESQPNTLTLNPIQQQTKFGIKLFKQLSKKGKNDNIIISPLSISLALSMVANGSNGRTLDEFTSVLELSDSDLTQINQSNDTLIQNLNSIEDTKLLIANSIWSQLGFPVKIDFINAAQQYHSDIKELDFSAPESATLINEWVREKTQNKISRTIERLSPKDVMVIINSVYFKGGWKSKFDPQKTSIRPFKLLNGATKAHPSMFNSGKYSYFENSDLQAIKLPYGQGRLSMDIFLPSQKEKFSRFIQKITSEKISHWQQKFRQKKGSIYFPRFSQDYEISLNKTLKRLGLVRAFKTRKADFSRLSDRNVRIDKIKHKLRIEVNEEGTEAAATTSIGIGITSVTIPFQMIVDRPFFFVIRDNETESILFMGSIVEPNT